MPRPRSSLVAQRGGLKIEPYWQLRYEPDPRMDLVTATEGLRAQLDEAVRARLISDVPLGAFLSGGIDSGAVVALMVRHSDAPVKSFSVGYAHGGQAFDERVYARELAARYGTEHHELQMQPDLVGIASSLVRAFDALRPDCVLIEGPPEAEGQLQSVAAEGMCPPVALLSYCPDEPRLAVYHPFAEFSPEWQALRWAVAGNVPAHFIDLPLVHGLAMDKAERDMRSGRDRCQR